MELGLGRKHAQRFSNGKDYTDPRVTGELSRVLGSLEFFDGDHARDFRDSGAGGVIVHECFAGAPGDERPMVTGNTRFKKKLVVFEIWECVGT